MNNKYTIDITKDDINLLYRNLKNTDESREILRNFLEQIEKQKHPNMFPDTPWNTFVWEANKKIIRMDGNRDAQREYILKTFYEMLKHEPKFDRNIMVSWFKSQMLITKNAAYADMFDNILAEYNSAMRLDLSKILS